MKPLLLMLFVALAPRAWADTLPVPPIPPLQPLAEAGAPVPNPDVRAPNPEVSEQPRVDVREFRSIPYDPGVAFGPGSRYRSSEDRKMIQTPGLSISVPLK
jgi:hypothetical protein